MANTSNNEDRKEAFCQHYVLTNGADASASARHAGYAASGSKVRASNLLDRGEVIRRIEFLKAQNQVRRRKTREDILDEYEKLAFSNIADVKGKPIEDLARDVSAAIAELTTSETVTEFNGKSRTERSEKVKLYDKKGALDSLAKMQGFLVDRHSIGGDPNGVPLETVVKFEFFEKPAKK